MINVDTLSNLTLLLNALSFIILGGCLHQIIFNSQNIEDSFNVIALGIVVSISVIIMTWESFEIRLLIGYVILFFTIVFLSKELKKHKNVHP